jgi:hypothetical protein
MFPNFSKFRGGHKLVLALLLAPLFVLSAGPVHAQYITITDNTCTPGQQCAGTDGQGCNNTTFSLSTTRSARLCASIKCITANGVHCLSVAYIYDMNGNTVGCVHNECAIRCDERCEYLILPPGIYTLYSCKLDCLNDDCSSCTDDCLATAQVWLLP